GDALRYARVPALEIDSMGHRCRSVALSVNGLRRPCDRRARNRFLNEDDGPAPTFLRLPAHVKPQVDLVEVSMKRDGHAENACVPKKEADQREQRLSIPVVELGSRRHERTQRRRVNLVAEHGEVSPLSREKEPSRVPGQTPRHRSETHPCPAFQDRKYLSAPE